MNKTKEEMHELFNETNKLTNNFEEFKDDLLVINPSALLIFRCFLKLSQKDFSKLVKVNKTHLCDIENKKVRISKKFSERVIKNIKDIMNNNQNLISFKEIYNNYKKFMESGRLTSKRAKEIRKLRRIYSQFITKEDALKFWRPVLNTPRLAKIVAIINGDGHLQMDKDRNLTSFNSNNFYEIENINKEFKELFSVNEIIYKDYKGSGKHKIFFSGKRIALFLLANGIVKGNKTNQCFLIPEWITKGSNKIKSAYLKGFYDTEGSIFYIKLKNNKVRWRIHMGQNKKEELKEWGIKYMEQMRGMLKGFKIESSPVRICKGNIRKDGSKSISLRFDIEKKGFKNFYKYIGFDNKKKQQRLIAALGMGASPSG